MRKSTITLLAILILSALALSSLGCNVDWREAVTTVFSGTEARAIQRLELKIPEEICKVEVLGKLTQVCRMTENRFLK